MKNSYVSGLYDGAHVDDVFLISSKVLRQARNGTMYIRMELRDCTGGIDAFKWDASDDAYADLPDGDFIHVRGLVGRRDGKLQLNLDSIRRFNGKVDPADFLPRADRDIDDMLKELRDIILSIANPQLKSLLDYFFSDEDFVSRFSTAPAAQRIHHAYIGGLLEHTLSSAKMCDALCPQFPTVDRDLLLTAAILHDAGKIEEFRWDKSIGYSTCGHLIGHIVSGAMMISDAIDAVGGFHSLLKMTVVHMILAHHGEREYGSPKRPKCIEGIILHELEDMDAKINTFKQAVAGAEIEGESDIWTDKHWLFDRPLLRGLPKSVMGYTQEDLNPLDALIDEYNPFAEE